MTIINTDLHTHIIPDVDDGSPDIESSLQVIEEMIKQGINRIFATSHGFAYIDEDESAKTYQAFHFLKKTVADMDLPVEIYLGCELLCMERWMDRLIKGLKTGQYPTLNGTKYVLIEFTTFDISLDEVVYCINRLLEAGYFPIFAHIERYYHTFASLEFIRDMKRKGCLFQISFNALYEENDEAIRAFAREIIDQELADFMGSDSHSMNHRPPEISYGHSYLKEKCSEEYLRRLLETNTNQFLL